MTANRRFLPFVFLIISLIAIILIAVSVSSMELKTGLPIPGGTGGQSSPEIATEGQPDINIPQSIIQGILAMVFLMLTIFLAINISRKIHYKRLIPILIGLMLVTLILLFVPKLTIEQPESNVNRAGEEIIIAVKNYPVETLSKPPLSFTWIVVFFISCLITIIWFWVSRQRQRKSENVDSVLIEAEKALTALNAGQDLRNVILACYLEMSKAIKESEGIIRESAMTIREFEELLTGKGIPNNPVHQLTQLFELVRYSDYQTKPGDELIARECLNQIVQHYGKPKNVGRQ